jgi:archaellum component FlaC
MDQMLNRIEDKLIAIEEKLNHIDTSLAVYNIQLSLNSDRVKEIEEELKPIKFHVERVRSIFWFLAAAIGLIATIAGAANLLH